MNVRRSCRALGVLAWIVVASSGAPAVHAWSEDAAPALLRAGAAVVDISPATLPAIRNGGFLQAVSDRVDDPLHARCLVLASGNETTAIVVVDSCMIPTDVCDAIKSLVTQRIGLPADRILISATHTHSAPSVMAYCLGSGRDAAYVNFFVPRVAQAVVAAHERLEPARIGWTSVDAPQLTNCRRWITRADRMGTDPFGQRTVRAMMHPGYQNPDYVSPAGPVDSELSVLSVVATGDGAPLCVLANYSMHYFGGGGGFSADYFGEVADLLENTIGDVSGKPADRFVGIMAQGTSGDLHWMDYSRPQRRTSRQQYAADVAARILDAWRTIEHRGDVTMAMAETRLQIARRVPSEERLEWARPINSARGDRPPANQPEVYAQQAEWINENRAGEVVLQAIRIGDLAITAMPNEVYGITGLKLKRQSPLPATFNMELANGAEGYIPPPEQHRLGGYTTWPARTAGLEEGAEPRIVETVLSLLETVSDKKRRPAADPPCDYSRAMLQAQPLAYWRLADMTCDGVADATGRDGANYVGGVALYLPGPGGTGLDAGPHGNRAVYFAGGHIEATVRELAQAPEYSVSMWFWHGPPTGAQPDSGILVARGAGEGPREALVIGGAADGASSGRLVFHSDGNVIAAKASVATRAWHHVALVRTQDRVLVYLDGRPEPQIAADVEQPASSARVFIGGDASIHSAFDGKLDEIAVFGRAISRDEVEGHYATSGTTPPRVPPSATPLGPKPPDPMALERYARAVIASSPLSYWRLHDGDRRTATDEMKRNDAIFEERSRALRPGPVEHNFTGGRLRAAVPNLGNTYSVEMWMRNELPHAARLVTGYMFSRGADGAEGAPGDSFGIGGTHSWTGRLFVYNGNQRAEALAGETLLVPGSWNHVVLVRDGESIKVYLDGSTLPEIEGRLPVTYPDGCEQLMLGGRNDNFANFQGMIEEFAVYNRALRPEEVKAHFAAAGVERVADDDEEASDVPRPTPPGEALRGIHVREGFTVELVASEPMVQDPVAIDWGPDGRLWVVEMADYPLGMDGRGAPGGRVRFLEDTDLDGQYDTSTLFADGLSFPTGILAWERGVLVTAAPEIVYLEDSNGDGRADVRRTLYSGFHEGNQQLRVNGLRWGLDNWIYCASGSHHAGYGKASRITSHVAGAEHAIGSRDFRIRPGTGELDPQSGPSQYGRCRDDWGNWFGVQNSHPLWHYVLADHEIRRNPHFAPPDPKHQVVTPANPPVYPASSLEKRYHSFEQSGRFTSACGIAIYRDELLFPRDGRQHAFTCEPFHNLVQHNVITDAGVSFAAHRDPAESKHDFFASEDRWCRPVMVRTGPDGALWVVDMYRYMIEHPEWLPKNGQDELRPYYRAGENHGRIYRIVPDGRRAAPPVRLAGLPTAKLVDALESPNGWQRDAAQQLLVQRKDPASVDRLRALSGSSDRPLARLHALATLDGMGALTAEAVERALADEHAGVRRHAVRLSPGHAVDVSRLTALADDADPRVRLQLAATLGELNDPRAAQGLARLALASRQDAYITAAAMSSLNKDNIARVVAFVAIAAEDPSRPAGQSPELVDELVAQATAMGDDPTMAIVVDLVCGASGERGELRRYASLAKLLDGLARRRWPTERLDEARRLRVVAAIGRARSVVADPDAAEDSRAEAAGLLLRTSQDHRADLELVRQLLAPQTSPRVQHAIVARAAGHSDPEIAGVLLAGWHSHSPALKAQVLSTVASRPAWSETLLTTLESREINPAEIELPLREQLSRAGAKETGGRWKKIFSHGSADDRITVLGKYRAALALGGDASRGEAVFRKHCATCHRQGDLGHEVGPNLASLTNKTPEALLASILDPNAVMEARYAGYVVATGDGRVLTGILAAETGTSIELLAGDGKRQVILRSDIDELVTSGKSLMPEGLERELSLQDLADVITFLRAGPGGR